ncbi:GNAT family N-acetyltransferase [Actinocorallia populi]|uniref:GNAT family N-acetyltransferase n=1 Tax=Actinocorallia populi TaxID=2079200 RepID=UPI000D0974E4|nr:GNAT family N-acetyltransferase [Actinocorallia populi]
MAVPAEAPAPQDRITIRPLRASDGVAVDAMHDRCSTASRRMRYFSAKPRLSPRVFERFLDRSRGTTLVVEGAPGEVVALGHMMRVAGPGAAELALLVEDGLQGRGLGRALAERMLDLGREQGLRELHASVLHDNTRIRRLLTSLGGRTSRTEDPSVLEIVIELREPASG